MQKILTRPSWQIFLLWMLPALFPPSYFGLVLMILWLVFMFYSMYFLCYSLYQKLPSGHDLNFNRFKFHLFFVVVYSVIVILFFDGGYEINQDNFKDFGWRVYLIVPLHILMFYCMFYILWFLAKAISTIQNKRVVTLGNYATDFFLLVLWPIGIFWVHPKVRQIFSEDIERRLLTPF